MNRGVGFFLALLLICGAVVLAMTRGLDRSAAPPTTARYVPEPTETSQPATLPSSGETASAPPAAEVATSAAESSTAGEMAREEPAQAEPVGVAAVERPETESTVAGEAPAMEAASAGAAGTQEAPATAGAGAAESASESASAQAGSVEVAAAAQPETVPAAAQTAEAELSVGSEGASDAAEPPPERIVVGAVQATAAISLPASATAEASAPMPSSEVEALLRQEIKRIAWPAKTSIAVEQAMKKDHGYPAMFVVERGDGTATARVIGPSGANILKTIPVSTTDDVMATLEGASFDISSNSPTWQTVTTASPATWTWRVIPREKGPLILTFGFFQKVAVQGRDHVVSVDRYPQSVSVSVGLLAWAYEALGPAGSVFTIVGAIAAVFFGLWQFAEARKGRKAAHVPEPSGAKPAATDDEKAPAIAAGDAEVAEEASGA
jgi:hypothetical protein